MLQKLLSKKTTSNYDELDLQIQKIVNRTPNPMDNKTNDDDSTSELTEFKKAQELLWNNNNAEHKYFSKKLIAISMDTKNLE